MFFFKGIKALLVIQCETKYCSGSNHLRCSGRRGSGHCDRRRSISRLLERPTKPRWAFQILQNHADLFPRERVGSCFFSLFSPCGASMLTRVGDDHWWLFELFRLLLVSLSCDFGEVRAVLEFQVSTQILPCQRRSSLTISEIAIRIWFLGSSEWWGNGETLEGPLKRPLPSLVDAVDGGLRSPLHQRDKFDPDVGWLAERRVAMSFGRIPHVATPFFCFFW